MAGKIRSSVFAGYFFVGWVLLNCVLLDSVSAQVLQIRGKTMGTTYQVKFSARDSNVDQAEVEKQVAQTIEKRLVEINASMSTYIEDSEISRFNRSNSIDPFDVSDDFLRVSSKALQIHELTAGRFDVTVGPLVRFWGFGGGETPKSIPGSEQVEQVLQRVGSKQLKLGPMTVQKNIANLEVDFSAIAKGFAVDEVSKIVANHSDNFMVEIGGEVRTSGVNPDSGNKWAIGVELPNRDLLVSKRDLAARVELANQALATSGDYRNFVVIEGKTFQHTIDPTTGYPVDRGILSVSVVADDCMTADGLATGMMVQPLEEIKKLGTTQKLGVFVIYKNDQGKIDWWKSDNFPGEVLLDTSEQVDASSGAEKKARNKTNPIFLVLGTVVVFGLAISGMAIGVIMSNRQLKGSCGGLSAMNENGDADASPCSLCTKPASECSKRSGQESTETAATE